MALILCSKNRWDVESITDTKHNNIHYIWVWGLCFNDILNLIEQVWKNHSQKLFSYNYNKKKSYMKDLKMLNLEHLSFLLHKFFLVNDKAVHTFCNQHQKQTKSWKVSWKYVFGQDYVILTEFFEIWWLLCCFCWALDSDIHLISHAFNLVVWRLYKILSIRTTIHFYYCNFISLHSLEFVLDFGILY